MKFMQITIVNGIHYQIGVEDFHEFKKKKRAIRHSLKSFVDIAETCSIRKSEIVSIEYLVHQEVKNES